MERMFFFGSLLDKALLEVVLDREVDGADLSPAWLDDHITLMVTNEAYPYLAQRVGARAEGVVFSNVSATDIERLSYYEEAEYGLSPITVQTADGPMDAVFFDATIKAAKADRPWDFDRWRSDDRAVALEAAAELMGHFGIVPVEEMDTIWHGIMIRARMRARAKAETPTATQLRTPRPRGEAVTDILDRPYTRYFAIEEHTLRHRRFDGLMSAPVQRTVLTSGDAVTVLPYDPARDTVMLIEQFRAPMHARGDANPWGVEVIAGRIDREMDAEACARREALEEGGLTLGRMEVIARYYSTPGFAAEHITAFVGQASLDGEGGLFGVAAEDEDIRAFTVPLDTAVAAIATGEVNNAPAVLSLLWLAQNRARLGAAWGTPDTGP